MIEQKEINNWERGAKIALPELPKTSLLVVQATPFCNIDCSYCYLTDRSSKNRLSFDTAEVVFRKIFRFPTVRDQVTVVWHAGEPLVLPVAYYERMFRMIEDLRPADLKIRQSFQTNATLLSDEWCDFIKNWDVSIGVSIDGPADLHDINRKQRDGRGTFDRTYAGLQKLQKSGIPFYVISVLGIENMKYPERMLKFYADSAIEYVCFNIEEQEGHHASSEAIRVQSSAIYRSFLERILHLNMRLERPILIREVETAVSAIQGRGHAVRNTQVEPFAIISVDCDANVSTFSPELLGASHANYGSFSFGNLRDDDFEEIRTRIQASRLYGDIIAGVAHCAKSCDYFDVCGGGAPSNKIFEHGSAAATETGYCRVHKMSIDVVLDLLERIP